MALSLSTYLHGIVSTSVIYLLVSCVKENMKAKEREVFSFCASGCENKKGRSCSLRRVAGVLAQTLSSTFDRASREDSRCVRQKFSCISEK